MKNKQLFNKQGNPVTVTNDRTRATDGKWIMTVSKLTEKELAARCGLYSYEPAKIDHTTEARTGKLTFDEKTGKCTHEKRALTDNELIARIEDNKENQIRTEFEAEQEAAKEAAFIAFKAKKEKKTKLN